MPQESASQKEPKAESTTTALPKEDATQPRPQLKGSSKPQGQAESSDEVPPNQSQKPSVEAEVAENAKETESEIPADNEKNGQLELPENPANIFADVEEEASRGREFLAEHNFAQALPVLQNAESMLVEACEKHGVQPPVSKVPQKDEPASERRQLDAEIEVKKGEGNEADSVEGGPDTQNAATPAEAAKQPVSEGETSVEKEKEKEKEKETGKEENSTKGKEKSKEEVVGSKTSQQTKEGGSEAAKVKEEKGKERVVEQDQDKNKDQKANEKILNAQEIGKQEAGKDKNKEDSGAIEQDGTTQKVQDAGTFNASGEQEPEEQVVEESQGEAEDREKLLANGLACVAAGLAIEIKVNIATCHNAEDRVIESLQVYAESLNLALVHRFNVWEGAICGAIGDGYAKSGSVGLKQAGELLQQHAEDVNSKLRVGVGGTKIPWLKDILADNLDAKDLEAGGNPPPELVHYIFESEASTNRFNKSQILPAELHVLEAIQWHEKMADITSLLPPEQDTEHPWPESNHRVCELQLRALGSLGTLYRQCQQTPMAVRFLTCAVKAAEEQGNAAALALACRELGQVFDRRAEEERPKSWVSFTSLQAKAIGWHERAQAAFSLLKDWAGVGASQSAIAAGLSSQKDHHRAIDLHKQALATAARRTDHLERMRCHMRIGLQYQTLAQHRSAVEQHEQHLVLAESLGDMRQRAQASCNLGVSMVALRLLKKAFRLLAFALQVSEAEGDEEGRMKALYALGTAHSAAEQHEQAAKAFAAALDIATALSEDLGPEHAERSCVGAGDANFKAGRFVEALGFYTSLVKLAQASGKEQLEARAKGYVGNATYWITHRWGAPPHQRVAEAYEKTTPPSSPRSPNRTAQPASPNRSTLAASRSPARTKGAASLHSPSKTLSPDSSPRRARPANNASSPRKSIAPSRHSPTRK